MGGYGLGAAGGAEAKKGGSWCPGTDTRAGSMRKEATVEDDGERGIWIQIQRHESIQQSKTAKKKAKKFHAQGSLSQPWQTGRAGSNRGKPCAKLDTPYIGTAQVQKWKTPCPTGVPSKSSITSHSETSLCQRV